MFSLDSIEPKCSISTIAGWKPHKSQPVKPLEMSRKELIDCRNYSNVSYLSLCRHDNKILVQQNGKNGSRSPISAPWAMENECVEPNTRCIHFYSKKSDFGVLHRSMTGKTIFNLVVRQTVYWPGGMAARMVFGQQKHRKMTIGNALFGHPFLPCTFSLT